jgi:hypothetical protein
MSYEVLKIIILAGVPNLKRIMTLSNLFIQISSNE